MERCVDIATHRHGCCVLQRCIDHATEEQKAALVEQVVANGLQLGQVRAWRWGLGGAGAAGCDCAAAHTG